MLRNCQFFMQWSQNGGLRARPLRHNPLCACKSCHFLGLPAPNIWVMSARECYASPCTNHCATVRPCNALTQEAATRAQSHDSHRQGSDAWVLLAALSASLPSCLPAKTAMPAARAACRFAVTHHHLLHSGTLPWDPRHRGSLRCDTLPSLPASPLHCLLWN